jgi:hypothetical protein
MYDQVMLTNVFFNWLHQKGRKRLEDGGERIRVPIRIGKNSTAGSYSKYEVLDTTPQDNVSASFANWKQLSVSIAISRLEERQNSGVHRILSLFGEKMEDAELSLRDEFSRQLFALSVGNSSKDLTGLPVIISDDATAGTLQSRSRVNDSFWRHQQADSSATTTKAYKDELRNMYNRCSKGPGGGPDMALFDQTSYEHYESALDDHHRYTNDAMANLGFDNVRLKGAMATWDERVPDMANGELSEADGGSPTEGSVFFINSKNFELIADLETDFINTPFVRPQDQDARVAQILFYGEVVTNNPRKNGLLASIQTAALTASTG